MAVIFPEWTNRVPLYLVIGIVLGGAITAAGVGYYFSPAYTDVGYQPNQPVPFSHRLHAGELDIDCRYCHSQVSVSALATVPPTQVCMNCHQLVLRDSPQLAPVLESIQNNLPLQWIRVHKTPEYAYFNHSVHINAGIGCSSCHGDVAQMDMVWQAEPLSMSWCLSCHRNPDPHFRPDDRITDTSWSPPPDQLEFAERFRRERQVGPGPTDCSACHR